MLKKRNRKIFTDTPISRLTRLVLLGRSLFELPHTIQLEPTTKCNFKCRYCIRSGETNCDMPIELFKSIINQLKPKTNRGEARPLFLTGLGEPFLNPNFIYMVKYAKKLGFEVGFTSNLSVMSQSIAKNLVNAKPDSLHISIDSTNKELFESLRIGANFEKIISNVKLLVNVRQQLNSDKPRILLNSVVSNYSNITETLQLVKFAEALGVDGIALTAQISPSEINIGYNKLVSLVNSFSISNIDIQLLDSSRLCGAITGCHITFDGRVLPCTTLAQIIPRKQYWRFQFGCLKNEPFAKIWFSKTYRHFRISSALGLHPFLCKYCPERATKTDQSTKVTSTTSNVLRLRNNLKTPKHSTSNDGKNVKNNIEPIDS